MALDQHQINFVYNVLLDRDVEDDGLANALELTRKERIFNPFDFAKIIIQGSEFAGKHNLACDAPNALSEVRYEDILFRLPAADFTHENLTHHQRYEPYVTDHLFGNLAGVTSFVDVGANLGLISLPVAAMLKGRGRVFAFEASSANANLLLSNAKANGIANLTVFPVGLSDANGSAFFDASKETSNKTLHQAADFDDVFVVPTVRLDDFWDRSRTIDMLKVDIEGFEYRFFLGARETIARDRPRIYIEYSDHFQRSGSGVPGSTLLDYVLAFGYRATILHRSRPAEAVGGEAEGAAARIAEALVRHIDDEQGTHLDLYFEAERA